MTPDPQLDSLLRDVLADEAPDAFRKSSLDQALSLVRRRRQFRSAAQAGTVALVAMILSVAGWRHVTDLDPDASTGVHRSSPTPPNASARSSGSPIVIATLTDQELLAAFPDRPVAIVGPPDRQEFVFLDELPASVDPSN